jgi:NADH:ubiquinone oxidoreductase subunit
MKPVLKIDPISLDIIEKYKSLKEASVKNNNQSLNIKKNIKQTMAGFYYCYVDSYNKELFVKRSGEENLGDLYFHSRPVEQFDLDGKFVKLWRTALEASKALKISYSGIIKCCKKKMKTSNNFKWSYLNDPEKIKLIKKEN